ncbi:MAG: DUF1553 domain-containing protein [Acidobacteria bacterium]|nr:DUF1553 domain-containing protein [Acidobacteriota bacterium]
MPPLVSILLLAAGVDVSFERDVISILTTKGCNSSGCHGSPAGQAGFKLSLYGSDPAADHTVVSRRIDLKNADNSLILRKPSFAAPHGGGHILTKSADEYRVIQQWIEQGGKRNASGPRIVSIEITPREQILSAPGAAANVTVTGRLSDGTTRDMTREVRYAVNDEAVVTVDATGAVKAKGRGLTTVLARGMGRTATAQFIVLDGAAASVSQRAPTNFIDREVFAKLREVRIEPYPLSGDDAFRRRVYLDAIGVLPTTEELAHNGLASARPSGEQLARLGPCRSGLCAPAEAAAPLDRAKLIDELLNRDEYTSHWLVKFEDWFRNSQYYSQGRTNASYKRWLAEMIRADRPYDEAAREMITATGDTTVHPAGNFWHPAIDFMLKTFEVSKATPTVTRLFLGQRIECAECHNHPLENLTQDDFYGMAAFLGRTKVKHGYAQYRRVWYNTREGEVLHPVSKQPVAPKFLDGTTPAVNAERRDALAEWITRTQKMQFARATVNRIWAEYFGAGIVEPADDFRSTNMASHPALLDQLAQAFIDGGFRFKPIHRLILNSQTYQASARAPGRANGGDPLERVLLARYEPRKLPAEVLLDAVGQVTGVPQTFGNYPEGTTAKDLVASIGSTYFLTTFGHPRRDIMEPRSQAPSLAQALHLMNADAMREKIGSPKNVLAELLEKTLDDRAGLDALYRRAYSRAPSEKEWRAAENFVGAEKEAGRSRRRAFENVLWAILNSKEFQLNQ